jgi:hypothetical protein
MVSAAEGGRIGLSGGGGPKIGRRGFLGLLAAGAAATPEIIKGYKRRKKSSVKLLKLYLKLILKNQKECIHGFQILLKK